MVSETDTYSAYVTKDKALYFAKGVTGAVTVGQLPAGIGSATFTVSGFISFSDLASFTSATTVLTV